MYTHITSQHSLPPGLLLVAPMETGHHAFPTLTMHPSFVITIPLHYIMSTDLIIGILTHQITQISTMCARGLLFSESLSHLWATCMWIVPCRSIVGFYDAIKLYIYICFLTRNTLFIYLLGVLRRFQHCTGHIMTGSWKGRGNQYILFVRVLYCKLLTNGKQLPAFPLEAVPGIEPRPQRWEARVLPLCHRGPPDSQYFQIRQDADRAFDNYRQDCFIRHHYGISYECL